MSKKVGFSASKFIKDFFLNSLPTLFAKGKSILILIVIGKFGGTELYGIWKQFFISSNFAIRFTSLNISLSINRFLSLNKSKEELSKELSTAIFTVFTLSLLVGGLIIVFPKTISVWIFGSFRSSFIIYLLIIYILIETLLNHYSAYFRARRRNEFLALINSARPVCIVLAVCLVLIIFKKINYAIGAAVIVEFLGLLSTFWIIYAIMDLSFKMPNFGILKKYTAFGAPLIMVNLGHWTSTVSDRYVILYFLGIGKVGVYSAAYLLGSILLLVIGPLNHVLIPDFSLLGKEKKIGKIIKRLKTILKVYSFITLTVLTLIIFYGDYLLPLLTSKNFLGGLQTMYIITVALFFFGVLRIFNSVLTAIANNTKFGFKWIYIGGINLLFNFLLIPVVGINGAALATLISYIIGMIIFAFELNRYFLVKRLFRFFPKIFVCSLPLLIGILLLYMVNINIWLKLFLGIISLILEFSIVFFVKLFSPEELDLMHGIFSNKLKIINET